MLHRRLGETTAPHGSKYTRSLYGVFPSRLCQCQFEASDLPVAFHVAVVAVALLLSMSPAASKLVVLPFTVTLSRSTAPLPPELKPRWPLSSSSNARSVLTRNATRTLPPAPGRAFSIGWMIALGTVIVPVAVGATMTPVAVRTSAIGAVMSSTSENQRC